MKTKKSSIILMIIFTIMTALSQLFLKIGANNNIFNVYAFLGILIYGLGTIIFVIALKNGNLSEVYPINSLSFIWVALIAFFYFNETITLTKIAGIFLTLTGTFIIGMRSKR